MYKNRIIETLELKDDDKLIITSSEKREGFGEVLTVLDEYFDNSIENN